MKKFSFIFSLFLLAIILGSCSDGKRADWLKEDDVRVAIDETFQPIMDEALEMFSLRHVEATVYPYYCSEDSAIRLLLNDSVLTCVTTRKLNANEEQMLKKKTLYPTYKIIATDAIALITNKQSGDSLISVDEIRDIALGKITRWEQLKHSNRTGDLKLVFDHSGSSTVRFIRDSICGGAQLKGNLYAQGSNEAVMKIVQEQDDVIGVIGANWLRLDTDTNSLATFSHLPYQVMKVSEKSDFVGDYYRPFQFYIATGAYPLHRSVYVITIDPRTRSQVKEFGAFLTGEPGQLLICKHSNMLPFSQVFVKRVNVKD